MRWQAQLATTLNNLAALAAQSDRLDEAESFYRRAVEIQGRLAERAPQVVAYTRDLAVSQNNFGWLLSQRDRPQAAVEQFEKSRANLSRLARGHDQSPEYASRLGAVYNNLGLAYEKQHSSEPAQAAYREAIEWQGKALALSPSWDQAQAYLDVHTDNLVRLLRATDQRDAADALESRRQGATQPAGKASGGPARQVVEIEGEAPVSLDTRALPADAAAAAGGPLSP